MPPTAPTSWQFRPLTLALLSGALGLLANRWSLPVLGETAFVFGGFFSLIATLAFGPALGVLATTIAFSSTVAALPDAVSFVCFTSEAFVVGILLHRRRWRALPAIAGFWILIGLPLALIGCRIAGPLPFPLNWAEPIRMTINGVVVALAAVPAHAWLARRWPATVHPLRAPAASLRLMLRQRYSVTAALPLAIAGLVLAYLLNSFAETQALTAKSTQVRVAGQLVQHHVNAHANALTLLARRLAHDAAPSHPTIEAAAQDTARAYPGFRDVLVADASGNLVAATTPPALFANSAADQTAEISSQAYFRQTLASRTSSVSEVIREWMFGAEAVVRLSVPVLNPEGEVRFVVAGSLDLDALAAAIDASEVAHGRDLALLDRTGHVVFTRGRFRALQAGDLLPDNGLVGSTRETAAVVTEQWNADAGRKEYFSSAHTVLDQLGWHVLVQEPLWNTQRPLALACLFVAAGALLAFGITLLLARDTSDAVTQPLRQLLAWSRRFSEDAPILPALDRTCGTPEEVVQLGHDLHAAAVNLRRSHQELAQSVSERDASNTRLRELLQTLDAKVLERTTQLQQARAAADSANHAKTEFLASMSHELRTPLNVVLGMSEVLREQKVGALVEPQLECVRSIEESGRHLLSLINDILDLSKIEAGKLELESQQISIRDVCEASLRFVREIAESKKLSLNVEYQQQCEVISADPRRLKQILVNLLSNAAKFTPDGGRGGILVTQNAVPPSIVFQVWDTGIGISAEDQQKLFKPFVQIDSELSRRYSGTGLGLALVKRMAEMHGGLVTVESTPNRGSRFSVILPLAADDLALPAAPPTTLPTTSPVEFADHPIPGSPLLLVAEDNPDNIALIEYFAQMRGCRTVIARTGIEAIARARTDAPDVILMDVNMPEMDGLEATRVISTDPRTRRIPVICVTANAMAKDRQQCLAAGASAYLSKPVNLQQLAAAITRLLPSSRTHGDVPFVST